MTRQPAEWAPASVPEGARLRLERAGVAPRLAALLARRGVSDAEEARRFLAPEPDHLLDPFLLAGMEEAVARLARAAKAGERVAVFGDYDVDGVTGTALLAAAFSHLGLETETVLPDRMRDGYGLQPGHVDRIAALGCELVVTVDCGSTSAAAIEHAASRGVDLIVTDHHLPPPDFPAAAILVNPHRSDCTYPFSDLSGVGLALKLATALYERAGRRAPLPSFLRIACLGTIADLVPLVGENRVIAALGLRALPETPSAGLRALMEIAGVKAPLRADDVGYRLGPRINAAGRLDHAEKALRLLMTRDAGEAGRLAQELDQWNRLRQEEEQRVVEAATEIFEEAQELPGILVASSPEWHRGVVGIAAGRLARRFHRPTILLAEEGDLATGSGRSIAGVHLHGFLSAWADRLERFGGHAAAVGLTVRSGRLERLVGEWHEAAQWDEGILRRRYEYEVDLGRRASEFDRSFYEELLQLAPFGERNRAPLVRLRHLELVGDPRIFGKGHVSAVTRGADGGRVRLIGWRFAERVEELCGRFECLGTAEWDDWVGAPVLRLLDVRDDSGQDSDEPGEERGTPSV